MNPALGTLLLFGGMLFFVFLGVPIAFALAGLAAIFAVAMWGANSLYVLASVANNTMLNYFFLSIPLFIFMAEVLQRSGIGDELYSMIYVWSGRLRGGLAIGTVVICTLLAALSGVSAVGTITMGLTALPAMLKRKYDKSLAMGAVSAGGALGDFIPPSICLIIYGIVANQSIGRLFMAAIFPGLLLASLFIAYIAVRCALQPELGPALPREETVTFAKKLASLKAMVLPLLLVAGVLGTIFAGVATATEAASIGALGSLACAWVNRKLTWQTIREAIIGTLRLNGMVMWIIVAAAAFTSVYSGMGAPMLIRNTVAGLNVDRWVVVAIQQFVLVILGCFLNPSSIIMVTTPIFLPIIVELGFSPIWFGILLGINMEMAYLTPPFGYNLFIMKSIVPKDITMGDIYRAHVPFVALQALALAIVMIFPEIALALPRAVFG